MCEQWQDMLLAYVNGTLTPDEMAALEAHLAVCVDCQAALDDWRLLARAAKAEVEALIGHLPPLVFFHFLDGILESHCLFLERKLDIVL